MKLSSKRLPKIIKQQTLSQAHTHIYIYIVENPLFFFFIESISVPSWISIYTVLLSFNDFPKLFGEDRCQKRQHINGITEYV